MKFILITGASSGLGAALATLYAEAGVTLFLQGRNESRLQHIGKICQEKGAVIHLKLIDVTDQVTMQAWINQIIDNYPLDLVIANAGISAGTSNYIESDEQTRLIFSTNLNGVLNTILPIIPNFIKRGTGQIAIISSLAGFRGLPSCPAYSASKAAVKAYGEALRGMLSKHGIKVCVVTPGYIKTPLTDINKFPMPQLMNAEKAAQIIKYGLSKNQARIAFPKSFYFLVWLLSCISPRFTDFIYSKLPSKNSF
jgi:short-subunit dehydrogenase